MKASHYEHGTTVASPGGMAKGLVEQHITHHRYRAPRHDEPMGVGTAALTLLMVVPFFAAATWAFGYCLFLSLCWLNPLALVFAWCTYLCGRVLVRSLFSLLKLCAIGVDVAYAHLRSSR